ncbi:hypothetical protein [Gordonia sp. (in: high G+C Gram-positive bacteria)]|uniref:hypothetical protein n=1 Tax=Gordonia sp. (in: high G+C Gram-positive bacteria) TaxID=84139 RepID=UPI003F9E7857
MSDPEVPQHEQKSGVDDVVDSANAGLAEAEAARADQPQAAEADAADHTPADPAPADNTPVDHDAVDPDLAAFEAAERDHPGTFGGAGRAEAAPVNDEFRFSRTDDATIADSAYAPPVADATETRVVPSEPYAAETVAATPAHQQPIFVQAPEPPRERGNRGTAGAIGLLATIVFAILYLGIGLGWSALRGDIAGGEVVDVVLTTLTTWAFWVPVAVFFIGFWLLGAIINRGRWGLWVVFGLLVGVVSYGGYILGQLFEAPFWLINASEATTLVGDQLFAPLAIASFVLGRELTIWFGAWVARSGARKTELNDEAQREYERTLEAGPNLSR